MNQAGSSYVSTRPAAPSPGIVGIVQQIAASLNPHVQGLNFPNLAVATAIAESSLNPTAVGDNGTSYGLFQLHQGGELGNLSASQAFNPVTNSTTALSTMSQVAAANPGASAGQIAAAAQRPANPSAYASEVQFYYDQLQQGVLPQHVTAYNGTGSPYATSPIGTAVLTSAVGTGGCAAKGNLFKVPLGPAITYCNLKAMLGGAFLVSGGLLCLVGIGIVVYVGVGSHAPLAALGAKAIRRNGTASAPAPDVVAVDTSGNPVGSGSFPKPATRETTTEEVNYRGGRHRGQVEPSYNGLDAAA